MSIKAGNILHSANGVVIDRIQTGGPTGLNIKEDKIYELGNYQTVATVRDIPQVTFQMDSFDVSCEVEALLTGKDSTALVAGDFFDFLQAMPIDVISPWKAGGGLFTIVKGIAVPYLTLSQASYKFGVGTSSSQSFSLDTDSIYYIPGSPYFQSYNLTAGINQAYAFGHTAILFSDAGVSNYALSVCVKNPTTHSYKRLFLGDDYSNTSAGVVLFADWQAAGYTIVHVTYGSTVVATYGQNVHENVSVKPAAVRGKDIDVYISDGAATPTMIRWKGVQTTEATWKVSLQNDEELGNHKYVSSDYDVADVSGSIDVKAADATEFFNKVAQVSNVSTSQIVGVQSSTPLQMEIHIKHPDTGVILKTLYIPDARIKPPAVPGKVQTKLSVQFPWVSDGGNLLVYNGVRPGSGF